MSMRTPTTEPIIGSNGEVTFPPGMGWETIANELAAEVTRLHDEIDRLHGGASKEPIASKADWTHPLYPLWVELDLDNVNSLVAAWRAVTARHHCPKCQGDIEKAEYAGWVCDPCQLVFYATEGHFAIDTVERAMDRGPDA